MSSHLFVAIDVKFQMHKILNSTKSIFFCNIRVSLELLDNKTHYRIETGPAIILRQKIHI